MSFRHSGIWSFGKALWYHARPFALAAPLRRLELMVCSPGGVATTMLMEFLQDQGVAINSPLDRDHLKHWPRPPQRRVPGLRLLYIYGDPITILQSICRREYMPQQCAKNGSFLWRAEYGNVDAVARAGKDVLNLNRSFLRWTDPRWHKNPCLLVNIESLWDELPQVLDYCGLAVDTAGAFPSKRQRSSSPAQLDSDTRESLERIFRPFYERMTQLQGVQRISEGRRE